MTFSKIFDLSSRCPRKMMSSLAFWIISIRLGLIASTVADRGLPGDRAHLSYCSHRANRGHAERVIGDDGQLAGEQDIHLIAGFATNAHPGTRIDALGCTLTQNQADLRRRKAMKKRDLLQDLDELFGSILHLTRAPA